MPPGRGPGMRPCVSSATRFTGARILRGAGLGTPRPGGEPPDFAARTDRKLEPDPSGPVTRVPPRIGQPVHEVQAPAGLVLRARRGSDHIGTAAPVHDLDAHLTVGQLDVQENGVSFRATAVPQAVADQFAHEQAEGVERFGVEMLPQGLQAPARSGSGHGSQGKAGVEFAGHELPPSVGSPGGTSVRVFSSLLTPERYVCPRIVRIFQQEMWAFTAFQAGGGLAGNGTENRMLPPPLSPGTISVLGNRTRMVSRESRRAMSSDVEPLLGMMGSGESPAGWIPVSSASKERRSSSRLTHNRTGPSTVPCSRALIALVQASETAILRSSTRSSSAPNVLATPAAKIRAVLT